VVGFADGVSFLLLLGVAMPIRAITHQHLPVRIAGSVHGGLFIAFCVVLAIVVRRHAWPKRRAAAMLVASVLPFGTFVIDRRLRRWAEEAGSGGGSA
jgi:integral membrane protein